MLFDERRAFTRGTFEETPSALCNRDSTEVKSLVTLIIQINWFKSESKRERATRVEVDRCIEQVLRTDTNSREASGNYGV